MRLPRGLPDRLAVTRELLPRVLDKIASPAVVGALVILLLASIASKAPVVGEHDAALGAQAQEIADIVRTHFARDIRRITIALAFAAIAIGLLLGTAAGILVDVRDAMCGRSSFVGPSSRSRRSRLFRALLLTLAIELWFVLEAMARRPQLYVDGFYARGGLRRTLQVLVTDYFGPGGVALVGTLALITYGIGLPRTRFVLRDRFRDLFALVRGKLGLSVAAIASAFFAVGFAQPKPADDNPRPGTARANVASPPRTSPQLNVLILAADSLRADRLDGRTMPNVTRAAASGARFERAYVSLPRTFPSWVTLLTGRYPYKHGIRTMFPTWSERARDFDALPSRFARAGYATAVVSDYAGDIFGRIDLGFERIDTPTFDFGELIRQRALERETPLLPFLDSSLGRAAFPVLREFQTAADPSLLAKDATSAIAALEGKPFFMTVFFSAAHFPYAASYPYYRRFTEPSYRGRFKYHKPVGLASVADLDADDVRQIRGLYDGAALSIDDAIGKVLRGLEDRKLRDRTIVIVTADHGETLFEHGRWHGHGDHLFGDESTRVPLVILDPRTKTGTVHRRVVRDVDLAPTLYELAGIEAPSDLDGRSVGPAVAGNGASLPPSFAYAETELWMGDTPGIPSDLRMPVPPVTRLLELDAAHNSEIVLRSDVRGLTTMARHRMVRDERFKLLYIPTRDRALYRLYDTEADPAELVDVALKFPAEVDRLKAELWRWILADKTLTRRGDYAVPVEP